MAIRGVVVLIGSLLLVSGAFGASATADARTAAVSVFDARIRPVAVAVDLNGTVTWSNKGRKAHVVVSLAGTFKPLVLRVGQSKRVTFKKRACERYSVDGKVQGTVSVAGAPCGAGAGSGSSGLDEKIYRYNVTVTAQIHVVETYTNADPKLAGTKDLELTWTGTWRRHEVKVSTGFGFYGIQSQPASQTKGAIVGHLDWSETRPINGGPCSGGIDYSGKASAILRGSRPNGSKPAIDFDASIVDASAIDDLTRAKQVAACKGNWSVLPHWEDETVPVVLGVQIHHPPGLSIHPMDTRWSHEGRVGTFPFPFDRVLAHRAFTIDSGVRTSTRSDTGFGQRFTGRVKYVFTPVS